MFTLEIRTRVLKSFVKSTYSNIVSFHTTQVFLQLPNHPLYMRVDWARVAAGEHAVVDPFDSHSILYLTEREYKIQVRVSMTQEHRLQVLATAGSSPEESSSDSAPQGGGPTGLGLGKLRRLTKESGIQYQGLLPDLEADVSFAEGGKPEILPTLGNLSRVLERWYSRIAFWVSGTAELKSRSKLGHLQFFLRNMLRILSTQGPKGLVVRMKASLIVMNRAFSQEYTPTHKAHAWVANVPIKVNKKGFPTFLHPTVRKQLAAGDVWAFRLWVSLLNSYKVFAFPAVTTLDSITKEPSSRLDDKTVERLSFFVKERFWPFLLRGRKELGPFTVKEKRVLFPEKETFLFTASPNGSVSSLSRAKDLAAWYAISDGEILSSTLWEYLKEFQGTSLMGEISRGISRLKATGFSVVRANHQSAEVKLRHSDWSMSTFARATEVVREKMESELYTSRVTLGKLHAIPEAAGKVRIVAMVDSLTQNALEPFHGWLNSLLKRLPTDGSFDQDGALRAYVAKGIKTQFSYDLSSATDRIPEVLYQVVFGASPLGEKAVDAWLALLIDRVYVVGEKTRELIQPGTLKTPYVEYATGQPMGALSSWPSMALVHHAVVQFCAWETGVIPPEGLFTEYVLLGDDIVIGDPKVARRYLDFMQQAGVSISKHKSYESFTGLVNFANQVFLGDTCLSPISLREALQVDSLLSALALGSRALSRGFLANPKARRPIVGKLDQFAPTPNVGVDGVGLATPAPIAGKDSIVTPEWSVSGLLRLLVGPEAWRVRIVPSLGQGRISPASRIGLFSWFYPSPLLRVLGFQNFSFAALAWVLTTHTPKLMSMRNTIASGAFPPVLDETAFVFALRAIIRWISRRIDDEVSTLFELCSAGSQESSPNAIRRLASQLPLSNRQWFSIHWSASVDDALGLALDAQIDIRRLLSYLDNPVKTIYIQLGDDRVCLQKGGEGLDQHKLVLYIIQILDKLRPMPDFSSLSNFINSGKEIKRDPLCRISDMYTTLLKGLGLMAESSSLDSRISRYHVATEKRRVYPVPVWGGRGDSLDKFSLRRTRDSGKFPRSLSKKAPPVG